MSIENLFLMIVPLLYQGCLQAILLLVHLQDLELLGFGS